MVRMFELLLSLSVGHKNSKQDDHKQALIRRLLTAAGRVIGADCARGCRRAGVMRSPSPLMSRRAGRRLSQQL
jgi:hypothetical protein